MATTRTQTPTPPPRPRTPTPRARTPTQMLTVAVTAAIAAESGVVTRKRAREDEETPSASKKQRTGDKVETPKRTEERAETPRPAGERVETPKSTDERVETPKERKTASRKRTIDQISTTVETKTSPNVEQTPPRTKRERPSTPRLVTSSPTVRTPRSSASPLASYRERLTLRVQVPSGVVISEARRCQVTPPPSDRMLDYRNPPQPPRKIRRKRRLARQPDEQSPARIPFSQLPRLTSEENINITNIGSPSNESPPGSPTTSAALTASVFRSLDAEFAAVADPEPETSTPVAAPTGVRLHSPPDIPRVTRSATRVKPQATRAPTIRR
ncbi:hypothetical protein Poli38472_001991 [Pythium oligandrum]|uniref:Uncharacterized protein n=1 Tax=Pythium oligandrum TaxID=41045 RepID=A0A8K1CUH1_PYTOL|nr:hypothetical protein Poli38472_001991 [Pythium oligandrum]|eukprot:TMW69835.1 hypothetical protein Poli38472_001991 [Pythium oligandrum]